MSDAVATIQKNRTEEVRIGLTTYNGRELVDVRVFAEFRDGSPERKPTKSGIAFRVEQLPELVAALRAAQAEAVRRGLLHASGGVA